MDADVDKYSNSLREFLVSNNVWHRFIKFDEPVKTVKQAAEKVDVERIVKSIVLVDSNNQPLIAILRANDRISYERLKALLTVKDVRLANEKEVLEYSGYPVGGVPPVNQIKRSLLDDRVTKITNVNRRRRRCNKARGTPQQRHLRHPQALNHRPSRLSRVPMSTKQPPSAESKRLIKKAEEIRVQEHRLTQNLRLTAVADIVEFVHSKGLVSVLGGNELPSLISAVLGKSWKPSSKGFSGWLDWWSLKIDGDRLARVVGQIERRDDILASRIFRSSKTLVSDRLWPIIGPIIDHHEAMLKKGKLLSPLELKIVDKVRSESSIRTDRLRKMLQLEGKANSYKFHRSLSSLESHGLIVGAEDPNPETHLHANIWQTWKGRTRTSTKLSRISYPALVAKLLERTIDGSIFIREDGVREVFQWGAEAETAKDQLLSEGIIVRAGKYLVHSRIAGRA